MTLPEKGPGESLNAAAAAVAAIAVLSILVGLASLVFESRLLQQMGHGSASILSGIIFLLLAYFVKRGSAIALWIAVLAYAVDGVFFLQMVLKQGAVSGVSGILLRIFLLIPMVRGFDAIRKQRPERDIQPRSVTSVTSNVADSRPGSISFVAPVHAIPVAIGADAVIGSAPPAIDLASGAIRFVAYRMEIDSHAIRAVYSSGNRNELSCSEIGSVVIRQLPLNAPWDGKLILDAVPVSTGRPLRPLRMLSTTFANYAALPQGAGNSSRENMRRLAAFLVSQNPSLLLDPATAGFINGNHPPARFNTMRQFAEYDSRYQ